jgi:SdpI/YhfL family protein
MGLLRIMFAGLPALMLGLGIPLALRLVPPNRFYGYRTGPTFASTEAWYQINFATGVALIAAGVLSGLCVLLLSQGVLALKPESRFIVGLSVTGGLTLLCLVPVAIYANRF